MYYTLNRFMGQFLLTNVFFSSKNTIYINWNICDLNCIMEKESITLNVNVSETKILLPTNFIEKQKSSIWYFSIKKNTFFFLISMNTVRHIGFLMKLLFIIHYHYILKKQKKNLIPGLCIQYIPILNLIKL